MQGDLQPRSQQLLSDYVTAIAWSPNGKFLAASTATGEVVVWVTDQQDFRPLQAADGYSINTLAFSPDSRFLAMAGQRGSVTIWDIEKEPVPVQTIDCGSAWIDQMAWSPIANLLAFNPTARVQIWDADRAESIAELPLSGTAQDVQWHPAGTQLAIACKSSVQGWDTQDWNQPPYFWEMHTAILKISWSPHGKYLAAANLDHSIIFQEWEQRYHELPFILRGFSAKIRHLAWSPPLPDTQEPWLAVASGDAIALWENQGETWENWLLDLHNSQVSDIAFQPGKLRLASASTDGWVCIWENAQEVSQILEGTRGGFSCLAWHPQGRYLAAGGQQGELLIWPFQEAASTLATSD
jgi:WD40 repeat protein